MTAARAPERPETAIADASNAVSFECNLCGTHNAVARERLAREIPSCAQCGSTVRWRATVHLVCKSLLHCDAVIPRTAPRRELSGVGLSDDACVARALSSVFDYSNTFYDTAPQLDIMRLPDDLVGRYDFVSASDVFEHIVPPVELAFANARRLLKPGGVLVFSVPFTLEPDTVEHFPELHEFRLIEQDGKWRLHNRTRDGREQEFDDLIFHGGPGSTLEMRVFSRAALERHFARAGFQDVRFAAETCERFGIVWPEPWSIPVVARA